MKTTRIAAVALGALLAAGGCTASFPNAAADAQDEPSWQRWTTACTDWDDWNKPGPAFRLHGNSYYVGTCGIAAVLITGDEGHILIDGGTQAGAAAVAANIEALGFAVADVRMLLHSHEHLDHVGGLATLQRLSGAAVYASEAAAPVLATGESAPTDPQFGMHDAFPAVRVERVLTPGETVRLGDLALTPVATPGHTAGALTWQWQSCDQVSCETLVYADSLSPVSRDDYRFSDHPGYLAAYRRGLDTLSQLTCTLLVTPHPSASAMRTRLDEGNLVDSSACASYAASISRRLDRRLEEERASASLTLVRRYLEARHGPQQVLRNTPGGR